MRKEDKRQVFHLFFGLFFAAILHVDRPMGIAGILAILFWGLPNYIYSKRKRAPITIKRLMDGLSREGEKGRGAIMFVLGCLAAAIFFPNEYCIPAIIVFSVSDSAATVIGIRYGRRDGKSIEGSLAFFFPALLLLLLYFTPTKAIITALAATVVEFLAKEDNLVLAPSIALISYILPI